MYVKVKETTQLLRIDVEQCDGKSILYYNVRLSGETKAWFNHKCRKKLASSTSVCIQLTNASRQIYMRPRSSHFAITPLLPQPLSTIAAHLGEDVSNCSTGLVNSPSNYYPRPNIQYPLGWPRIKRFSVIHVRRSQIALFFMFGLFF